MIIVRASSIDTLSSTNGVKSCGVTLFVTGSLVLVETRARFYLSQRSFVLRLQSPSVAPSLVTVAASACASELAVVRKSLECYIPIEAVLIILAVKNWSEEPSSKMRCNVSSCLELLKLN